MKKHILLLIAACCSIATFADEWQYSAGTISYGGWTFAASVKSGTTEMTVNAVTADPGANATLDFSLPISDGTQTYTLVTLNPNFGAYANAGNLKTLVLPASGLTTISKDAFKNCTSLTSVSPFLPDSVTTVGEAAFQSVPIVATLSLKGVVTVNKSAFKETAITNAVFGAALKTLYGGWVSGCFYKCTSLTTVDFDPAGSGAKFDGESVFACCSKLSGTLDLRGFSVLGNRPFYDSKCSVQKLILSSDITSVMSSFFHSFNAVKEISFDGGVPTVIEQYLVAVNDSNHTWSDVYTVVPEANKDAWAEYCENKSINQINSYFDPSLVTKAKTSNLYLIYKSGGGGGETGYWVFDGTHLASSNHLWQFEASKVGVIGVSVGKCVVSPTNPEPLDFSESVTDADGGMMGISTYVGCFYDGGPVTGFDKVSSVIFPDDSTSIGVNAFRGCTGITTVTLGNHISRIDKCAFYGCTSLTSIEPCFPDSLAELGQQAFYRCPMVHECVMNGIQIIGKSAIRETGVRSVYIGSSVKSIGGGYTDGAISYNSELTNITLSASITNAEITGEHVFCENTKLCGTIDFRGFKIINGGRPLDSSLVTNVIFGADLSKITGGILEGMSKLQSVYFLGAPPTDVGLIFNQPGRTKRISKDQNVVTYVYKAHADSWKTYAADQKLNSKTSTWSPDYLAAEVTDLTKRKLLVCDLNVGLRIILR